MSHRLSRVTSEGTVYTIAPRYILPRGSATVQKGTTTTFWLTLHVPDAVKAGDYTGRILLRFADGRTDSLPPHVRLFATPLAQLPERVSGCRQRAVRHLSGAALTLRSTRPRPSPDHLPAGAPGVGTSAPAAGDVDGLAPAAGHVDGL